MSEDEFWALAQRLYNEQHLNWRLAMQRRYGVTKRTLERWRHTTGIPVIARSLIKAHKALSDAGLPY